MPLRRPLLALALAGSLGISACGDDSGSADRQAEEEAQATPAQAVAEIGEVRTALDRAVASLKAGNARQAEETVAEGYLQHFEKVEGPLEKVDGELNESLEEAISTDLRQRIKRGASLTEVRAMVGRVKADLAEAERKLR
jgi:DNA anti-recombination protein RmuC